MGIRQRFYTGLRKQNPPDNLVATATQTNLVGTCHEVQAIWVSCDTGLPTAMLCHSVILLSHGPGSRRRPTLSVLKWIRKTASGVSFIKIVLLVHQQHAEPNHSHCLPSAIRNLPSPEKYYVGFIHPASVTEPRLGAYALLSKRTALNLLKPRPLETMLDDLTI